MDDVFGDAGDVDEFRRRVVDASFGDVVELFRVFAGWVEDASDGIGDVEDV